MISLGCLFKNPFSLYGKKRKKEKKDEFCGTTINYTIISWLFCPFAVISVSVLLGYSFYLAP